MATEALTTRLALLTALGLPAVAQGSIGGPRPTGLRPRGVPTQEMTGSLHMNATGEIYLEDGSPAYVGFSWRFDPLQGDWVFGKQVFHEPQMETLASFEEEFHLLNVLDTQTSVRSSSSSFSISASTVLLKAAASLEMNSSSGSSVTEESFVLEWTREYGPSNADFDGLVLTQDALSLLAETDGLPPEDQAAAWLAEFGTHVAVGYRNRATIRVNIRLVDSSSFESSSTYASMRAQYKAISGSADIASALEEALRHSFLEVNVTSIGVDLTSIQLPTTVGAIDEPHEKQALLQEIAEAMDAANSIHGLLLIPSYVISGVPTFSLASFEHPAVGEATTAAHAGINAVVRADGYTNPASRWRFFEEQPPLEPGFASLGEQIESARSTLVHEFDDLWNLFYAYLVDPSSRNAGFLSAGAVAANEARSALEALLDDIDALLATQFPFRSMQIIGVGGWGGACGWPNDFWVDVGLENVALFCPDQLGAIANQLEHRVRVLHSWSSGQMQPGNVVSIVVTSSAPSATDPGLRDISFRMVASLESCWQSLHLEFEDDFSRDFIAATPRP